MKVVAPLLAVLLSAVFLFLSFWRYEQVGAGKERIVGELMDETTEWYLAMNLEAGLLAEIFAHGDEVDDLSLGERREFWNRLARVPSLPRTLYLLEEGEAPYWGTSLSFDDGTIRRGRFEEVVPYREYLERIQFSATGEFYDYPIFPAAADRTSFFLAYPRGEGILLILLDREALTSTLFESLMASTFSPDQLALKGWSLSLKVLGPEAIPSLERDDGVMAYPLSSLYPRPAQESFPSAHAVKLPDSLAGNEHLSSILMYRQSVESMMDSPEYSSEAGPILWLLLEFDENKLFFAALKRELGWIFLVYSALILLVVLFIVLVQHNRRVKEQVKEQMMFVANVTHELRTPLGVLCNAGANIADGFVSRPEDLARYGELILTEGRRLGRMVESVLLYSGLLSGRNRKETIAVDAFLPSLLEPAEFLCAQRGIRFEKAIEEGLTLCADREGLQSAVSNLLNNGVIHGGAGKFLRLAVRGGREGRGVFFSVRDLGPGIGEAERRKIFAPFYRGAETQRQALPGSGIGLSLVEKVAKVHGGSVKVESEPGRGALFTLYIPAGEEPK